MAVVLLIDNYDSFTYNLVQYLGELGAEVAVRRNDVLSPEAIDELHPDRIVISPGPGRPENAGVSVDVVRRLGSHIPILGVCLGHQAIALAFGGTIVSAPTLRHGKTSMIEHDGRGVLQGLINPFPAGRYHSLAVCDQSWPVDLELAGHAKDDGTVMALRHKHWPVHGVQFHPESVLTSHGRSILRNFLEL